MTYQEIFKELDQELSRTHELVRKLMLRQEFTDSDAVHLLQGIRVMRQTTKFMSACNRNPSYDPNWTGKLRVIQGGKK